MMTGVYVTLNMVYRLHVCMRRLHQVHLQELKGVFDVESVKVVVIRRDV